jgi:adenylate cyclase
MSHSGATQQSGGHAQISLGRESPAGGPQAAGAGTPSRRRVPNWLNPFGGKQWKWRRGWTRVLIATQVFAAVLLILRVLGVLQSAELGIYDRLVVAWSHPEITDRVVIVAITEDDIGTLGWPLRDADLAALLSRLTGLGARAVGIDLYRDRPLPPGSEELAQIREQHPEINWVIKLADKNNNGIMPSFLIPNKLGALADVVTDPGGVVRRGLMAAEEAATGRTVLALGTRMAQRYLGKSMRDADDGNAMIGNGEINLINETWGPYAHIDASGYQTMLDFRGGTDRFRRISYARMMHDDAAAALIKGHIVLVGVDALSVPDRAETPFSAGPDGAALPGVLLHGYLADQLIRIANGETASQAVLSPLTERIILWGITMAAALTVLCIGSVEWIFAAMLGGLVLICGTVYLAFGHGVILPGVPSAIAWIGAATTNVWMQHGIGMRDRQRVRRSFEHYLDTRIIKNLMEDDKPPEFGGEYREITALFTDVAGFTTIAESMPPTEIADHLHDYFDGLCTAVMECGGLISDFVGDGLLALFGAPQPQEDHADRAVEAALHINAFSARFVAELGERGIKWGATRIGVHSGMAVVGNIGTRKRLKYGAIGDVLNTASRIEGLNKRTGTRIAVSGDAVARCTGHGFRAVGEFVVVGRSTAMPVCTPLTPEQLADEEGTRRYEAAYEALRNGDPEAAAKFQALRLDYPDDPCIAFHCDRLAAGATGFEIVMTEK